MARNRWMLYVEREDGSYYFLEGNQTDLQAATPKDDLFGKVVDTKLLRRNP